MQEWGRIRDNLETRSEVLNPKEGKTEHDGWRAWTRKGKEVSTPVPALSAPYVMVYLQSGVWYFPYKIIMKVKSSCLYKITFCEMNGKQIWPMIGPIFQMDRKMGFNHDGVLGWYSYQAIENLVCEHEIKNLQEPAVVLWELFLRAQHHSLCCDSCLTYPENATEEACLDFRKASCKILPHNRLMNKREECKQNNAFGWF